MDQYVAVKWNAPVDSQTLIRYIKKLGVIADVNIAINM